MRFPLLGVLLCSLAAPARADVFVTLDGRSFEGVVSVETPETLEVQVGHGAFIPLDRAELAEWRKDEAGRAALLERWREEDRAADAQAARLKAEDAAQRAKGLLRDGSEWVTEAEFRARTERQAALAPAAPAPVLLAALPQPAPAVSAGSSIVTVSRSRRGRRGSTGDLEPEGGVPLSPYQQAVGRIYNALLTNTSGVNR